MRTRKQQMEALVWLFVLALALSAAVTGYQDDYTSTNLPFDEYGRTGCYNDPYLPLFVCENLNVSGSYLSTMKAVLFRNVTLNQDNTYHALAIESYYEGSLYALRIQKSSIYARGSSAGDSSFAGNLSLGGESISLSDSHFFTYATRNNTVVNGTDALNAPAAQKGGNSYVTLDAVLSLTIYNVTWDSHGGDGTPGGDGGAGSTWGGRGGDGGDVIVTFNSQQMQFGYLSFNLSAGRGNSSGKNGAFVGFCMGGNLGGNGGDSALSLNTSSLEMVKSDIIVRGGDGGNSLLDSEKNLAGCTTFNSTLDGGEGGDAVLNITGPSTLVFNQANLTVAGGEGGFGGSNDIHLIPAATYSFGGGKGGDASLLVNVSYSTIHNATVSVTGGKGGQGYSFDNLPPYANSIYRPDKSGGFAKVEVTGDYFITNYSRLSFISKGAATVNGSATMYFGNTSDVSVSFNLTHQFRLSNMTFVNVSSGFTRFGRGNSSFFAAANYIRLDYSDGLTSGIFANTTDSETRNRWVLTSLPTTNKTRLCVDDTYIRDNTTGRFPPLPDHPYTINVTSPCDADHYPLYSVIVSAGKEQSVNYESMNPTHRCDRAVFYPTCAMLDGNSPVINALRWKPYPTGDDDNFTIQVNCSDIDSDALSVNWSVYKNGILSRSGDISVSSNELANLTSYTKDDTVVGDNFTAVATCSDNDMNTLDPSATNTTIIRNSPPLIAGCPMVTTTMSQLLGQSVTCARFQMPLGNLVNCTNSTNGQIPNPYWDYTWYLFEHDRTFTMFYDNAENWTHGYSYSCPGNNPWDTCYAGPTSYAYIASITNNTYAPLPAANGGTYYIALSSSPSADYNTSKLERVFFDTDKCSDVTLTFIAAAGSGLSANEWCNVSVQNESNGFNSLFSATKNDMYSSTDWDSGSFSLNSYRGKNTTIRFHGAGNMNMYNNEFCLWDNVNVTCTIDAGNVNPYTYSCSSTPPVFANYRTYHTGNSSSLNLTGLDNSNADESQIICSVRCARSDIEDLQEYDFSSSRYSSNAVDFSQYPNMSRLRYLLANDTFFSGNSSAGSDNTETLSMIEFKKFDTDAADDLIVTRGVNPMSTNWASLIHIVSSAFFSALDNSYANRAMMFTLWYYNTSSTRNIQQWVVPIPPAAKAIALSDINGDGKDDMVIGGLDDVVVFNRTAGAGNGYINWSGRATFNATSNNVFYNNCSARWSCPIMNFSTYFGPSTGYDIEFYDFDGDNVSELLEADYNVSNTLGSRGAVRYFNYRGDLSGFPNGFAYEELFNDTVAGRTIAFQHANKTATLSIALGDFNSDSATDISANEWSNSLKYYKAPTSAPKYMEIDLFGNGNWDINTTSSSVSVEYMPPIVCSDYNNNEAPCVGNGCAYCRDNNFCYDTLAICLAVPCTKCTPPSGGGVRPGIFTYSKNILQGFVDDCGTGSNAHYPTNYSITGADEFYGTCDYNVTIRANEGRVKVSDVKLNFNMTDNPWNTTPNNADLAKMLTSLLSNKTCDVFEPLGGGYFDAPGYEDYCVVPVSVCTYANTLNVSDVNINYMMCES